jgi:hypothetical protein
MQQDSIIYFSLKKINHCLVQSVQELSSKLLSTPWSMVFIDN